jgi:hypothetical protein
VLVCARISKFQLPTSQFAYTTAWFVASITSLASPRKYPMLRGLGAQNRSVVVNLRL